MLTLQHLSANPNSSLFACMSVFCFLYMYCDSWDKSGYTTHSLIQTSDNHYIAWSTLWFTIAKNCLDRTLRQKATIRLLKVQRIHEIYFYFQTYAQMKVMKFLKSENHSYFHNYLRQLERSLKWLGVTSRCFWWWCRVKNCAGHIFQWLLTVWWCTKIIMQTLRLTKLPPATEQ